MTPGPPERPDPDLPKERRWGWVIVAGHFMNVFIMVGTAKSIGILLQEIHVYFDVPMAIASLLMTVAGCIFALGAPLGTVLGEHFTARAVVMTGGVIVLVGISLSSLLLNVSYTIILYGVGMGVANSVIYGNGLVLIGQYFNKHRSLATGLSLAGGSLGQFAVPPILQYFLETYLLGGTLLLVGGIYFHVTLFAALFRSLSYYEKTSKENNICSGKDNELGVENHSKRVTTSVSNPVDNKGFVADDRVYHEINKISGQDENDLKSVIKTLSSTMEGTYEEICRPKDDEDSPEVKSVLTDMNKQQNTSMNMYENLSGEDKTEQYEELTKFEEETQYDQLKYGRDVAQSTLTGLSCTVIRKILDFSILKNYVCIFYTVFSILSFFGHFNFVLILPSYAIDKGITDYNKAFLVSITGAFDLVGRVFFGYLGDLGFMKRYMMQSLCLIFLGIDILIYIFASGYPWMASLSAVFGFLGGGYVTLIAVVLVDLAGLELLAKTLAVVLFTQGIAYASGQPLLGLVRDLTGSYDLAVCICCGCCFLSGVMLLFAPKVQLLQKNRKLYQI